MAVTVSIGMNAALATVDEVSKEIGAKADETAFVQALILRASSTIETACNRRFADDYVLPGADGRTLPYDIEAATVELVRRAYHAKGRDPGMRSSHVEGVATVSYFDVSNMPDVLAMLEPYRVRTAL